MISTPTATKIFNWVRFPLLALAAYLGITGMLNSYALARLEGVTDNVAFLFWGSYFVITIPLLFAAMYPGAKFWTRMAGLAGIGFISALPKIFRSLQEPLYQGEYGLLKSVSDILESGVAHWWNGLPISPNDFPAMPLIAAFIIETTGLDLWTAVNLLLIVIHILTLLGLFLFLRVILSPRAAAAGTLLYVANPNWMFYHNQFNYETFALMLFFWLLFFVFRGLESASGQRVVTLILSGPVLFLLSVTYPITFIVALLLISILLVIAFFNSKQDPLLRLASLATGFWLFIWSLPALFSNHETIGYYMLEASKERKNKSFSSLFEYSSDGTRNSFETILNAYTTLPTLESIALLMSPLVLISIIVIYFVQRSALSKKGSLKVGKYSTFSMLGFFLVFLYLISFILIPFGEFGLLRVSWTYTLIGFTILGGLVYESYLLSQPRKQRASPPKWKIYNTVLATFFIILSISSVTLGTAVVAHYPTKNSVSATSPIKYSNAIVAAQWAKENLPKNSWIITDRYTGNAMIYPGGMQVAPLDNEKFSYWDIFLNPNSPSPSVMKSAETLGVKYLIVNRKVFQEGTTFGYWFGPGEIADYPDSEFNIQPDKDVSARIGRQPWTETVWANEHYVIYKIIWQQYVSRSD
jgi:hypothetical protein